MHLLNNNVAVLEGDQFIAQWVRQAGRLDHDDILHLVTPMIKPGDWVVDVGAYIGGHTAAYLRAVGPEGRVYAIEPNPHAFACLKHNCPTAHLKELALGSQVGVGYMQFNAENPGASWLMEGDPTAAGRQAVHISRLDLLELPRLDFLKIDAEGWEPDIIRGGISTICSKLPRIMMEVNRHCLKQRGWTAKQLFEFMAEIGYLPSTLGNDNIESPQIDLLFLHNEHKK